MAFGQVLDRVGVALGMDFPCGQELDELAIGHPAPQQNLFAKDQMSERIYQSIWY